IAAAEPLPGDPVMGLRSLEDGYVPPILDVSKLDRKLLVSNAEAVAGVRALLDQEGVFAGVSAGAVVHVARRLAAELDDGVELAVLRSHVSAPARPSRTDVENIGLWEGRPYLILSLGTGELAAFTTEGGRISDLQLSTWP